MTELCRIVTRCAGGWRGWCTVGLRFAGRGVATAVGLAGGRAEVVYLLEVWELRRVGVGVAVAHRRVTSVISTERNMLRGKYVSLYGDIVGGYISK